MKHRLWMLFCALGGGLLTACHPVATPVAIPPLDDSYAETSSAVVSGAAAAEQATLEGSVWYRQRSALPEGAVVEVSLLDVSRADAPASVLAKTRIEAVRQVPVAFSLTYSPGQIQPTHSYAVQARILLDDRLLFISTERYAVLTRDAPSSGVQVRVDPV